MKGTACNARKRLPSASRTVARLELRSSLKSRVVVAGIDFGKPRAEAATLFVVDGDAF
jgi:hypothetical protein